MTPVLNGETDKVGLEDGVAVRGLEASGVIGGLRMVSMAPCEMGFLSLT